MMMMMTTTTTTTMVMIKIKKTKKTCKLNCTMLQIVAHFNDSTRTCWTALIHHSLNHSFIIHSTTHSSFTQPLIHHSLNHSFIIRSTTHSSFTQPLIHHSLNHSFIIHSTTHSSFTQPLIHHSHPAHLNAWTQRNILAHLGVLKHDTNKQCGLPCYSDHVVLTSHKRCFHE